MKKQNIDVEFLSEEREDIIEMYFKLIENVKLKSAENDVRSNIHDYNILTNSLTILERNINDRLIFIETNRSDNNGIEIVVAFLMEWYPILDLHISELEFCDAFAFNLLIISSLLANIEKRNIEIFRNDIFFLSPKWDGYGNQYNDSLTFDSNYLKNSIISITGRKSYHMMSKFGGGEKIYGSKHYEHIFEYYQKGIINVDLLILMEIQDKDLEIQRELLNSIDAHVFIEKERNRSDLEYVWKIDFILESESYSSKEIGYLMWTFSQSIEFIDGVSVELMDWSNGSKRFSLKLWIKNLLAKEEVQQILDKSRDAVESKYLDKPIADVEKTKAESNKLIRETENLPSKEQAYKLTELEIQRQKLELIKGYADLMQSGILQNDSSYQILINEILYLSNDTELVKGESMEIISQKEQLIKKDEITDLDASDLT